MEKDLNSERALIFRIVHRENVRAMLEQGLLCRNALQPGTPYVQIGNAELIDKRLSRRVEHPPGGTLADYVPFYFTPFSPMMYNIYTGYNGITKRSNRDIVFFISSLKILVREQVPFLYTDRHAYLKIARFTADLKNLPEWIDWKILQARSFSRDETDKVDRYQAEALVYRHLPIKALSGIACYTDEVKAEVRAVMGELGHQFQLHTMRQWYF